MSYTPKVNDYVRWTNALGQVTEGWVYFADVEYISIEISVKPKDDNLVPMHKKNHCLVVCHKWYWNELEYIKTRKSHHNDDIINPYADTYKSQQYRHVDP